ncbi:MAG: hypothetical protein ACOH2F_07440 [Cellulomonas sp.]
MTPTESAILLAVVGVVVLGAMRVGWRHRVARSAAVVPELYPAPAVDDSALGAALTAPIDATYVSTTLASDWLDRVAAHGLGARSIAVVQVFDTGVLIFRTAAPDLFLPAAAMRAAGTSSGIAGKVVGHEGLVVLTWQAPASVASAETPAVPGIELTTGLRLRHAADRALLIEAAGALASGFVPPVEPPRAGETGARNEGVQ